MSSLLEGLIRHTDLVWLLSSVACGSTLPTPFSAISFFHVLLLHARMLTTIALSQSDLSLCTLVTNGTAPQPTFIILAVVLLMHLKSRAFQSGPT